MRNFYSGLIVKLNKKKMKQNGSEKKGSKRPNRENKPELIQKRDNKLDRKHKNPAVYE